MVGHSAVDDQMGAVFLEDRCDVTSEFLMEIAREILLATSCAEYDMEINLSVGLWHRLHRPFRATNIEC
jgi:hypothetical protein